MIRPLSYEDSDISWEMFDRKYRKVSLYSEGFTEHLLKAFSSALHKKPESVLSEPWFQGKTELYLFTKRIAGGILGPPNPPNGGKPPYGFQDDDFRGKWIFIDPKLIKIVPDTMHGKGRTVLFPVILNPSDPSKRKEIWVKAGLGVSNVTAEERENVEAMLMRALQEVQLEGKLSNRVEDKLGRVQITLNTVAAFEKTQEEARRIVLGAI